MATVNKQAVAAAFGRAASGYTQHDELQRRCADLLLRQLARRDFAQVLDAGCGPGSMSRYWREAGSVVTALDLSAGMLAQAQRNDAAQHYLLGDIEALPLPDACVYDLFDCKPLEPNRLQLQLQPLTAAPITNGTSIAASNRFQLNARSI